MVMSMDVTGDQTMSSSPPDDLNEPDALAQSPSPFQNQASLDGDEHDDEHSKCSGQTIVTMQQQQQRQQQTQQRDLAPSQNEDDDADAAGFSSGQHEQRMVLSGGSSFDEDDKRLLMNVDEDDDDDDGHEGADLMGASLRLEQAELEARLTQAKSSRFGATTDGDQRRTVESSLVAQMRDIVEGGNSSSAAAGASNKQPEQNKLDNKENTSAHGGEPANGKQPRGQPRSSSDSLNNQNDNGHSRASIDSATGLRRTRHSRAHHHCKQHNNNDHHHHHHHHHHHAHQQRHRQSISGGSLPGQVEGAESEPRLALKQTQPGSTQAHSHHHHPHHHHQHHHNHGRHRHSNSSHPHHHHHHHHHHKRGTAASSAATTSASKRNSIQRLSLAMIESSGLARSAANERDKRLETSGQPDQKAAATESNNSSLSSVSTSAAAAANKSGQQHQSNNPNQSNPESKSSESPPTDERVTAGQEVSSAQPSTQAAGQPGHGHHHHAHHHHHHHHCHHRSHKKRLVLDAGDDQPEPVAKADSQTEAATATVTNESGESCDLANKRRPLQDLASGANASASGGDATDQDQTRPKHLTQPSSHNHPHPHHHHHGHHQLHHRHHHHHNVQCVHHQRQQGEELASGAPDEETPLVDDAAQLGRSGATPNHHHHHCMHRHHRHHHHHHTSNNHAHHHHCRHQRGHVAANRNRQKSVSQSNVDRILTRDSIKTLDKGDENDTGHEARLEKDGQSEMTVAEGRQAANDADDDDDDGVVKMETSPPPLGTERRQSLQRADKLAQSSDSTGGGAQSSARSDNDVGPATFRGTTTEQAADSDPGNAGESSGRKAGASELNQEAQFAESNQENFRAGDARDDTAGQQQQANKLTRQMSSQSSRKSQKEEGSHDDTGNLDNQNQNEHLRECAKRALQPAAINQQRDETRQVIESSVPSDRRCRLCWCCCCPCSALSTRDASNRAIEKPPRTAQGPPSSPMGSNYPSLPNVSLDEIRCWGESFDKLMKSSDGRKVFQDFLRCEYSEENILFWAACEELKKERDSKNIASKARDIYEDYISILSSKEVSLDSRVRDIINNNIKKPTSNIFDEAQLQIYTLMHRDSYPRFINSIMYKKLAQIPMSNSRKSSS